MNAEAELAEIAFCIGDPSRASMLWSLMGRKKIETGQRAGHAGERIAADRQQSSENPRERPSLKSLPDGKE